MSETEPMTGRRPQRGTRRQSRCLGKKCFVISVVVLFLFLTFIALPGGVLLIVHGGKSGNTGCVAGGAILVCLPLLATIILASVFYGRRRVYKLKTQNTVTTTAPV